MQHRHLAGLKYTLAAIDDVIARGKWIDWVRLRSAALSSPALLEKIASVSQVRIDEPYAQRHHFWRIWADIYRTPDTARNSPQPGENKVSSTNEDLDQPLVVATLSSGGIMNIHSRGNLTAITIDFQELDAGCPVSKVLEESELALLQAHFPEIYGDLEEYLHGLSPDTIPLP
jgi:hypothetical protein